MTPQRLVKIDPADTGSATLVKAPATQRMVGAARSDLLANRPHVFGSDGLHAVQVVVGRAGIGAGHHRPPGAVEVLDQRLEPSVRPLLVADRPHIRSGRCGGTEEDIALRSRLGTVRDRPVGAVPGLDERAVLEVTVQADANGPCLAALRGDAEQCVEVGAGVRGGHYGPRLAVEVVCQRKGGVLVARGRVGQEVAHRPDVVGSWSGAPLHLAG